MRRKTRITQIHRSTTGNRSCRLVLACGHELTVTGADFEKLWLYLGKRVECAECAQQEMK